MRDYQGLIMNKKSNTLAKYVTLFDRLIRLIPANSLTRKLTSPIAQTLVRKRDIATQIIGFLLLITGLALSMLLNI